MLPDDEKQRYQRQIIIGDIGETGQEKLKQAKVVIAGSGGLGSASATYLAAAGVGTIKIIDGDRVELSNLNRQVLHWSRDISREKATSAAEKLKELNPKVSVEAAAETIDDGNVSRLVAGFDIIVDALDNLPTRYLLNREAIKQDIPFIHGAVYGFEGRVLTIIPGKTACLRCVYRGLPPEEKTPVIGVTPAVIGCLQATEAIKYVTGSGRLLTNRLLVYDGLNMKFTELNIARNPACEHCGGNS